MNGHPKVLQNFVAARHLWNIPQHLYSQRVGNVTLQEAVNFFFSLFPFLLVSGWHIAFLCRVTSARQVMSLCDVPLVRSVRRRSEMSV